MNALEYAEVMADFFREHGYRVIFENESPTIVGSPTMTRMFVKRPRGREVPVWVYPDRIEIEKGEWATPSEIDTAEELAETIDAHLSNGFEAHGFFLVKKQGSKAPPFKRAPKKTKARRRA